MEDHEKTNEQLRESEENFRSFFETLDDLIIVSTPDGKIMYTNPAVSNKLGYSTEELRVMHVLDLHPKELREEAERIFANMFKGEGYMCPLPLERKNGVLLPVDTRVWFGKWSGLDCIFGLSKDLSKEQEALQKFDRLFRHNPALMAVISIPEQLFTDVNESFLNTLGFAREEVIGRTPSELGLFVQPEIQRRLAEEVQRQGTISNLELKMRRKDGTILDVLFSGEIIMSQGQKCFLTVMIDLTERKRAEASAREHEERYRVLIENIHEGIFVVKDGVLIFVNPRTVEFMGYSEDELTSEPFLNFVHPDDREMVMQLHINRMEGNDAPYQYTVRIVARDGSVKWLSVASRMILWHGERAALVSATDITSTKVAEDALRESERQLRTLVNAVPGIVYLKDGEGRWLEVNENGLRIFELQDVDYKGKSELELAEYNERYREALLTCKETDERAMVAAHAVRGDEIIPSADGSENVFDIIKVPLFHPDGRRKGIVVVGQDITDRKKAEEALRRSEERLKGILDASPVGMGLAQDRVMQWVNEAWVKMFGFEERQECVGRSARTLYPSEAEYERVGKILYADLRDGRVTETEARFRRKDGTTFDGVIRIKAVDPGNVGKGTIAAISDLSERKRAEELLLQAERFRAVSDLAGGVAHNFNNLLQIVIGNLELALMDLASGNYTDVKDSLEKVLESSRFGAETVRRLQSFAGIRDHSRLPEKGVFDLSGIVRQAVEMSKTWWKTIPEKQGKKVSLNVELQDGCLVQCEKNELFEVVVNLVKNATEALFQDGMIDVETRVEVDRVVLKVRDTGIGISEKNLKRLFNPFFTTKASAGSGLGLASSRKIIEESRGTILVDSSEGHGTTFTVFLPLAHEALEQPPKTPTPVPGPQGTVLVIDDMEAVLEVLKSGLTRSGHVVVTASSGEKGLDIFSENPIDLVICDLGMPGMTGWEVGKRIRTICQERGISKIPFIILTGWGGQRTETEKIAESGVDAVVEKPINMGDVLQLVRQMVAEKATKRFLLTC